MNLGKYKSVILGAIKNEIEAKEFYAKISKRIKDSYLQDLFEDELSTRESVATALLSRYYNTPLPLLSPDKAEAGRRRKIPHQ